jgi:hypothetical protein
MPTTISGSTGVNLSGAGNQVAFPDSSVQATAATGFGFKNAIINGDFDVNQRAVSGTVTLAVGVYGHDRWKAGASGCTYTFATSNNVTTLTISSGSLIQVIEGLNLQSGTYTLSWTGTAQGKIGAGSYASSGITGLATGGTNLNIEFGVGTVSLIQFEKGSTATPFDFRSIGQELVLCQRYFQLAGGAASGSFDGSTTTIQITEKLLVTMRIPPAGSIQPSGVAGFRSAANDFNAASPVLANFSSNTPTSFWTQVSGFTGGTSGAVVTGRNNNANNNFIALSAEL